MNVGDEGPVKELRDQIMKLGKKVAESKAAVKTEEATKMAFVLPFIRALGYEDSNPEELEPEYGADAPGKKGLKVDYAVKKDSHPIMLIECKSCTSNLGDHNDPQLFHYFSTTAADNDCDIFCILTNGIRYRFYTDLVKKNVIDQSPFLEFDITDVNEATIDELAKFHKLFFQTERIKSWATEVKCSDEIADIIKRAFDDLDDDFVKFFVKKMSKKIPLSKKDLRDRVRNSLRKFIGDKRPIEIGSNSKFPEKTNKNDQSPEWTKPELIEYLGGTTPYQKLLLSALVQAEKEPATTKIVTSLMNEIAKRYPSEKTNKVISGRDIAGARSGLKMRRKPLGKEDIIDAFYSKEKKDHFFKIKEPYKQIVLDWVKARKLWIREDA